MTRHDLTTATIKPALPPKPLHLSPALTGTLDTDAFRSYIRQQSTIHQNDTGKQQQHTLTLNKHARAVNYSTDDDDDDDDDDKEENEVVWGTAKQSPAKAKQHTPSNPAYGKLVDLFNPNDVYTSGSQVTVRPKVKSDRQGSEGNSEDKGTIKMRKINKEGLPSHIRDATTKSGSSSSNMGTERSRQPSILSQLSGFSDEQEAVEVMETPKKEWMHARDGSAFEHAGPKKILFRSNAIQENTDIQSWTALVIGPPPLRPASICVGEAADKVNAEYFTETNMAEENGKTDTAQMQNKARSARALYAFTGKPSFNELSLFPGQSFDIISEDVGGGWSSAIAIEGQQAKRGLVPRGWYTYVQEFSKSPLLEAEKPNDHPQKLNLDSPTRASPTTSYLLSPKSCKLDHMSRSKSEASEMQKDCDQSRPASGFGQVYSEAGAAMQALTQMQRCNSNHSHIAIKTNSAILSSTIQESSLEKVNTSKFNSSATDSVNVSTSLSSLEIVEAIPMSSPFVASKWKSPSLFGGRSLNRFIPFVTSGAEDYLLFDKTQEESTDDGSADRFEIISGHYGGPSWSNPGLTIFVEVHSPEVHVDEVGKQFTAYVVYSSYSLQAEEALDWSDCYLQDPHQRPQEAAITSSVYRRFNQFRWLFSYLGKFYPALVLTMPPFPCSNYGARFDPAFVEKRRRQLQTWLVQVVRHPVLPNDAAVRFFLDGEEEGKEWLSISEKLYQEKAASNTLFSKTYHPLFNVDMSESALEVKQFTSHSEAYQRALSNVETGSLASFQAMRQTTAETSDSYRQLSFSLLRLITGSSKVSGKANTAMLQSDHLPPMGSVGIRDTSGATNEERAWCWRRDCKECNILTRSLQSTADALYTIADYHADYSNGGLFELHDRIAAMAQLNSQQSSLTEVHKSVLAKYREAIGESDSKPVAEEDEDTDSLLDPKRRAMDAATEQVATRCESVINITMSEMDRIHTERIQNWNSLSSQFLDMQIEFYQDVLSTLQNAKERAKEYQVDTCNGPILPSPFESQLGVAKQASTLIHPEPLKSSSYFAIWK